MLRQRMEAFIPNVVLLNAQVTFKPFDEAPGGPCGLKRLPQLSCFPPAGEATAAGPNLRLHRRCGQRRGNPSAQYGKLRDAPIALVVILNPDRRLKGTKNPRPAVGVNVGPDPGGHGVHVVDRAAGLNVASNRPLRDI